MLHSNRFVASRRATLATITAVLALASVALGGDLNPPTGPVTPTPGPEPRIAINATNTPGDADSLFKITQPGSYYLSGNIKGVASKHGIEITASGVTLDLNGFELLGVLGSLGIGGSLDGVHVGSSVESVQIRNGSVRNWAGGGVVVHAENSALQRLHASGNKDYGLRLGAGGVVEGCAARSNGDSGIVVAEGAAVRGSVASFNGGVGIIAARGATISGNTVRSNGGDGIIANASTVSDNTVSENVGDGILVFTGSLVRDNLSDGNGNGGAGAGIHATSSDNRIEGNLVTDNDRGIDVDDSGNLIIRNSASGNTFNYDIVANNVCFVVPATTSGAILGFSGGVSPGTTDPWANFSF